MFNNILFFRKNLAFREITAEKQGRAGQTTDVNITGRLRVACWITESTNTHLVRTEWANSRYAAYSTG